ncbi:hypothetical protein [Bacillus infantis]|uniref:Uncharacterized protein n=1 Tax=Bacillus infantis TaxID=324767 RepID=A0A5D4RMH8_9BACI|nr:hypothetical protein [Bacillus infantis]TYS50958.1 hypothetical protein FZD51_02630 [Bacillus infantis]
MALFETGPGDLSLWLQEKVIFIRKVIQFFMFILIVSLFGCSKNPINDDDVLELLKVYKKEQYTIEEPSDPPTEDEIVQRIKTYLSTEALEELSANRVFSIAPDIASHTNKPVKVNDVQIKELEKNEDGTADYTYTVEIQLGEGANAEIIKNNGQLTVSSEDGLKIIRDWEEKDHFKKFY